MAEYVGHEVVEGVRDLLPVLRDRAQETEDARVVPAESVKSLAETGFFRLLQPASFGGLEADPLTFYTAVRLIASACGSTGWACSVLGVHPWHVGLFPPQVQQEVWGDDPATRISSSYAPTGRARLVEGGHQVSGRWSFSSGCDHATWVLLGQIVPGYSPPPESRPVNRLAIASLMIALMPVIPVLAVLTGLIALGQIHERGERGAGVATAGIVIGALVSLFFAFYVLRS